MFSFDLSLAQGNMSSGSMGFSLFSQPTKILVEKSALDEIIGATHSIEEDIKKYLGRLRSVLGKSIELSKLKITIEIPKNFRHHTGLGLTTQITGGVIISAAEVYGKVMSPKDLFNIGIGQVSALGINLMYNPGFIMEFGYKVDETNTVNAHPELYTQNESPSGSLLEINELPWSAVVAVPRSAASLSGDIEDDFWSGIYPDSLDSSQAISYAVFNYITPALISNNFDMFIKGMVLATETGTKPAEESIQNQDTKAMLAEMRRVFGFAAISSLGPAIYSFARTGDFEDMAKKVSQDNFELIAVNLNQPGKAHYSIHTSIPADVIKNNQLKYFFEDKNIPYDILGEGDARRLRERVKKNIKSKIIVSFACLGKTYFASKYPDRAIDLESLPYRFDIGSPLESIKASAELKNNGAFPLNYVETIVDSIGKYEYIFVVLSIPALKMLDDIGIQYTILYPDRSMIDVVIERARSRGNNDTMIDLLYRNLSTSTEIELAQSILKCNKYVFVKGNDYIEDLVERGDI